MKYIACLAFIVALTSCATTATPINLGDGKSRFFLDCGRQGMAQCIAKANEVCPQGYNIDGQGQRTSVQLEGAGAGTHIHSTMRISCK